MLERDLQEYLFGNPGVLFPNEMINRKRREAFIEGRRTLNLAWRLVHRFENEDSLWSFPYDEQNVRFGAEYAKLKPLIDFFQ